MKATVIAGTVLTALVWTAQAEEGASLATSENNNLGAASKDTEVQHETYQAGNQLLIDISSQVGGDLDARLEQEVGREVTVTLRPRELLVSKN